MRFWFRRSPKQISFDEMQDFNERVMSTVAVEALPPWDELYRKGYIPTLWHCVGVLYEAHRKMLIKAKA